MNKEDFCPHCEDVTSFRRVTKLETLPVMGEPVEYQAHVCRCSVCGGEYATTEQEEENFKTAYYIYRQRHNLLTPEQIRAIREKYGLSQRNFSRLLGWGDITVHRYESGALQDTAYNVMLVLIDDPLNALKVFMLNRSNLAPGVAEKLKRRIQELIKKGSGQKPGHDMDEVCGAADSLSSVSVKESEHGGYNAKAGRLAGGDGSKPASDKTVKMRKP